MVEPGILLPLPYYTNAGSSTFFLYRVAVNPLLQVWGESFIYGARCDVGEKWEGFCFWGVFSRSGALKAANLQQCIGTAEGSLMWLGDEWAYNREWPE